MILPSLRKLRITRWSTLPSTATKRTGRRVLSSVFALTALAGSWAIAAGESAPEPAAPTAEQTAAARWQELREQFWPSESVKKEVARETVASHLPARTTLEQLGADTFAVAPSVPSRVSARGPVEQNSVRPVTARLEPGRVVHSFSDTTEPLAAPSAVRPVQMLSLSEFLASEPSRPADMALVQVTPPPAPIPEGAPIRGDGLQGGLFTSQVDTVFQPITQIQPYQNYSPTAAAEGKIRYDYICPQPSSVPADQRVSCPEMQELPQQGSVDRHFAMTQYCWVPTNLFHHPLYFEDVALERYGQQYPVGIQPFVSLGRFGIQFLGLPYQMALDPVHREIYPLGYYRPGDPAPELEYRIPFNAKAAATAAGVYTAFVFLIP